jgi:hypothetical protein
VQQQKEQTRNVDIAVWLESLGADIRYAWRSLMLSPGFTLVAVLSIAEGFRSAMKTVGWTTLRAPATPPPTDASPSRPARTGSGATSRQVILACPLLTSGAGADARG